MPHLFPCLPANPAEIPLGEIVAAIGFPAATMRNDFFPFARDSDGKSQYISSGEKVDQETTDVGFGSSGGSVIEAHGYLRAVVLAISHPMALQLECKGGSFAITISQIQKDAKEFFPRVDSKVWACEAQADIH